MSVAVVYLARLAEGVEPIRRFANSYRRRQAGRTHSLTVIYKADDFTLLPAAKSEFAGITHRAIMYSDAAGVDLAAYRFAATQLPHDRLAFFNTFAYLKGDDWLAKMDAALDDRVGIVGATGSYESVYDSLQVVSKAIWMCSKGMKWDRNIAKFYADELRRHVPGWLNMRLHSKIRLMRDGKCYDDLNREFPAYWDSLFVKGAPLHWYLNFPRFPNAHIRSNAFMARRHEFIGASDGVDLCSKESASLLESGYDSLTNVLAVKAGRRALIVGADGRSFDIQDWPNSGAFRSQGQKNLLVSDNRTDLYERLPLSERRYSDWVTWGIFGEAPPPRHVRLGLHLPCDPSAIAVPNRQMPLPCT